MQGTFALSYLVQLAIARTIGFFRHWYADGSRAFLRTYRTHSRRLEDAVASRAMLQLLFRPLYGDYSVVGRIIGPIFRLGRLLGGAALHLVLAVGFAAAFAAWSLLIPAVLLYAAGVLSL